MADLVQPLDNFGKNDIELASGKNASLGEMLGTLKARGVRVPDGLAVTVAGYREFIAHNELDDVISAAVAGLDATEDRALAKAGTSNDKTQLVLGVDRDSSQLAHLFDERNPALLAAIEGVIAAGRAAGQKLGICRQGPNDHPDLAEFLVRLGIGSIAVNPDALVNTRRVVAAIAAELAEST